MALSRRSTARRPTRTRLSIVAAVLIGAGMLASLAVPGPGPVEAEVERGPGPVGGRFPTAEVFVDQIYRDVLSRPPDPAGLRFWADRIQDGTAEATMVSQLLASEEFDQTVAPVVRLYRTVFDRRPDLGGLRFWVGERQRGQSLVRLAQRMLAVAEFDELYGDQPTADVVAALYRQSLGRDPDTQGLGYWVGQINDGHRTWASVVVGFSESPEQQARMVHESVSSLVFLGLLGRLPEPGGLGYWTGRLASGLPVALFVAGVMASDEFAARFPLPPSANGAVEATALTIPWDLEVLPADQGVLFTERGGRIRLLGPAGSVTTVGVPSNPFISGESGVMGLALDPSFASTGRFYVCHGHAGGRNEIRVTVWTFSGGDSPNAVEGGALISGIPIASGRHGGCQLEFGADGSLYVGTGDAAIGTNPQNRSSLAGKVLRVDASTGGPVPPAASPIFTYGHRNVQGLADRGEVSGELAGMWSVEHGPARDDEVNRLVAGGNAGWNPVGSGVYDESVPMTDRGLGNNVFDPAYATGAPTLALSGAEWLDHPSWGAWRGALAVTALKDQSLRLLFFSAEGRYLGQRIVINGDHGRLRGITEGPDGALWLTTSTGDDQIIRFGG